MAVLMQVISPRKRGHGRIFFAVLSFLLLSSAVHAADTLLLQEGKIRAGLVYNFLKYTTWPEAVRLEGGAGLQVCLLGGDSFDSALYPLQGRTAQQYKINILSLGHTAEAQGCNAVYIHRRFAREMRQILSALEGKNILTLSDIKGFSRQGGMVELSTQADKRIHLSINPKKIAEAGLQLDKRMSKLAQAED